MTEATPGIGLVITVRVPGARLPNTPGVSASASTWAVPSDPMVTSSRVAKRTVPSSVSTKKPSGITMPGSPSNSSILRAGLAGRLAIPAYFTA